MRRRRRMRHLRNGLRYGYPLCCVLSWVFDPYRLSAVRRGGCRERRPDGTTKVWVPCRWHQGRHPAWRPFEGWHRVFDADGRVVQEHYHHYRRRGPLGTGTQGLVRF